MLDLVMIVFIFALGACVGSFLNVVIYRMPREESIAWPPSHCPSCGRGIRWFDNIPILSWLALRGRCRYCRAPISPQYILVELLTGLMLAGLYAAYFIVQIRTLGRGTDRVPGAELTVLRAWPMFIAHAALLAGLLACAVVDWRHYIVPLPVMWTVALIGAAAAVVRPHPFLAWATPTQTALAAGAAVGLLGSLYAVHTGLLMRSFADADERPAGLERPVAPAARAGEGEPDRQARRRRRWRQRRRGGVGFTAAHGVRPRVEVLRELLFLLPALVLAAAAWAVLHFVPAAGTWWGGWFDAGAHPALGPRLCGLGGALFALLIGGAWIWGTRIVATLALGREAMGMGDVHILAGVGAVTGWVVPSLAFFAAPVSGIVVVLYLFITRRQRELPYGPWLALGTVLVMLLYDAMVRYLEPGIRMLFD